MIRARLLGHPLHPALAGFPVALWTVGLGWDLAALLLPRPPWSELAFWTLSVGLIAAIPALITGFWELVALRRGHPAERTAWWHMGTVSVAFCCILISVLLRRDTLASAEWTPLVALVMALAGVALTIAGGWLGGELVFRHGVGVAKREEQSRDG